MIEIYENPAYQGWSDLSKARIIVSEHTHKEALEILIGLCNDDLIDTTNCYLILKETKE